MHELDQMRRANPFSAQDGAELLSERRQIPLSFLEQPWDLDEKPGSHTNDRPSLRHGKTSAAVLAGAAVILAFLAFMFTDPFQDRSVIEASVAAPTDNDTVLVQSTGRGFDRSTDLLVVHLDYTERSDSHAAAAAREITSWFGLDPLVVAGTSRSHPDRSVYGYEVVMHAVWGEHWVDAGVDRATALRESSDRWLQTLDAGGHVWVAEGGVSDFTAELVGQMVQQRPDLDTDRLVHVIQHSMDNEDATALDGLAVVRAHTAYVRIDSGSELNATADFAAQSAQSEVFELAVLSGAHSERWLQAFDYEPASELNFADAVAVLDVLDLGVDIVGSVDDYVEFFIGDQPDAALRGGS